MIDQLVEKYAMGFKRLGVINDVWENPSKKEMAIYGSMFRFIADAKHKKVYVFDHNLFHTDVWARLKVEKKDPRSIYEANDLFGGTVESNRVFNWGVNDGYYDWEVLDHWLENMEKFDWANKWVRIDVWMKKNRGKMGDFVSKHEDMI
jgi:hypothetical protein